MLEFFKQNKLFNSLLLLPYTIILRFNSFLIDFDYEAYDENILTEFIYQLFSYNELLLDITAILMVFIQGVFVNLIVIKNRLSTSINLFPGVFYILLVSLIPEFQYLSAELIATNFLLIAIAQIFGIYNKPDVSAPLFNSGFSIALASMFCFNYILFIPAILTILLKLRKVRIIEVLQFITGFNCLLFLIFTLLYSTDQLGSFSSSFAENLHIGFNADFKSDMSSIKLGVFLLLILITLYRFSKNMVRRSYKSQKQNSSFYMFLLMSIFVIIINVKPSLHHLMMMAFPLAVLSSFLPTQYLKRWYAEGFHLILFMLALIFQYSILF